MPSIPSRLALERKRPPDRVPAAPDRAPATAPGASPLLDLQRTLGNRAVQRFLAATPGRLQRDDPKPKDAPKPADAPKQADPPKPADAPKQEAPDWFQKVEDVLPPVKPLLSAMHRQQMLLDIFGEDLLKSHAALVSADAAAAKLTRSQGVAALVALYDTRQGDKLDAAAAEKALSDHKDRYERNAIQKLRLASRPEASPTFFFQDPASQTPAAGAGGGSNPTPVSQQRAQVHVEAQLSTVGKDIAVRFAYPATEVSASGTTSRVAGAKQSILLAIAEVVADLNAVPEAADQAERNQQLAVRARLKEVLKAWSPSSPLNVFVATEPSPQELMSGQVAAVTDRAYVNLSDVGDKTKLQAAVRIPLTLLTGGAIPTAGGVQQVQGASKAVQQRTLLHEGLHTLLSGQGSDADAIWEANKTQLAVQGSPTAGPLFVEMVRKYLISQEEVFAYENEASLYPPVSPNKALYDSYLKNVKLFFDRRKLTMKAVKRSIPVKDKVAGKAVPWNLEYQVPSGTVSLTVDDLDSLNLLLSAYPLK